MRLPRRNVVLALTACAVAVGVFALPAGADYGGPLPKFHNLFRHAVKKVRAKPKFARAVMLEVDGTTAGQPVKHARGIVKVRFVFNNQGTPHSPFVEDRQIPHAPRMTLKNAVTLLRKAGYDARFSNVTLRKPLEKHKTHPLYIFGLGKKSQTYVAVDTVTGKVHPLS